MTGTLRIARIGGIDIEIHVSWFFVVALVSWSLADSALPDQYEGWSTAAYWAVGVFTALLVFTTVLVHELAHAFVAKRRGLPVPRITLFIFGGVSQLAEQPPTARAEFAIAIAGPLTSFAIALLSFAALVLFGGANEKVEAIFTYIAATNVLLGAFNLLPGFPLDGGRVLRSLVWGRTHSFRRATAVAGMSGELFAYLLLVLGVVLALSGLILDGVWLAVIGWFLHTAAASEAAGTQLDSVLKRLHARDLMHTDFVTVTPGLSIQEVVDAHMLTTGERAVVVADGESVRGILTVNDIRHLPREEWLNTPAQRVMTPREKVVTVAGGTPAMEVLRIVSSQRLNQVPVIDEGRMVGLITRRELLDRIQLAESLAPDVPNGPGTPDVPDSPPSPHL